LLTVYGTGALGPADRRRPGSLRQRRTSHQWFCLRRASSPAVSRSVPTRGYWRWRSERSSAFTAVPVAHARTVHCEQSNRSARFAIDISATRAN